MSRRHHHHNLQPYDYDRFNDQPRDRTRDQARAIEYQDDSLSSINSDEESYLHHTNRDKKSSFYSKDKSSKNEKNSEPYHPKEPKSQPRDTKTSDSTVERLERLETMLEEFMKRSTVPAPTPSVLEKGAEKPFYVEPPSVVEKKGPSDRLDKQFYLEPRRHTFTTSMWINKIQEMSFQNNWDEKTTIQYMVSQMSGTVKAWYNSLPNYDYTWPEWKLLICKVFPDNTDFVTTLKRLVTRLKQADESMTTYYFSKMYLIEACKITGEDAVSCLIDGLNNQTIQIQAKAQNFLTPETLYSQFLMVLPEYSVDYAPSGVPTEATWYYSEDVPSIQSVNEDRNASQEQMFGFEADERSEKFNYPDQANSSFEERPVKSPSNAKPPGPVHSRLDKRYIRRKDFKKQSKVPLASKVCSICLNRGHVARNCRRKVEKVLYSRLSSSGFQSCFYKTCTVNGQELDSFIDTGCTTVTITEEKAHRLKLHVDFSDDRIQTYGGGSVRILGETEVLLKVDSVQARVKAVVVPNNAQEVSVIVGQGFLNLKNVGVLLQNNTLKIYEPFCKLTD
ncbi:uncharacterized protein LOC103312255 [Tribolium castaneum]|uniref:CCHC-type domain-containing protein n=1 Tax=Tribolium castaneum TaxID=7070 RepID=D6WF16_TRICA|nr:PREDICTED: uncharacterized protein LOC103312255 [Tribolium castaneum]EFA00466.1 hypothetical protein TcasGA2_TC003324 [Tribolium castaneum]|eukprot:XP_008190650.1 PREDICTED: uncharacterized protein LOC103312255 [Tribolium castaneum]